MTDLVPVQVDDNGSIGLSTQDIAALGSMLTSHGFTQMQVQALMGRVQKIAMQVTLNTLRDTLEDIRRIQEARMWEIVNQIRALPTLFGGVHVSRERVIQVIQMTAMRTPRE